jgi:hypothetical protein
MAKSPPTGAPRPRAVTKRLRLHGTIAHNLGAMIVTGRLEPGTLLDNQVEASIRRLRVIMPVQCQSRTHGARLLAACLTRSRTGIAVTACSASPRPRSMN